MTPERARSAASTAEAAEESQHEEVAQVDSAVTVNNIASPTAANGVPAADIMSQRTGMGRQEQARTQEVHVASASVNFFPELPSRLETPIRPPRRTDVFEEESLFSETTTIQLRPPAVAKPPKMLNNMHDGAQLRSWIHAWKDYQKSAPVGRQSLQELISEANLQAMKTYNALPQDSSDDQILQCLESLVRDHFQHENWVSRLENYKFGQDVSKLAVLAMIADQDQYFRDRFVAPEFWSNSKNLRSRRDATLLCLPNMFRRHISNILGQDYSLYNSWIDFAMLLQHEAVNWRRHESLSPIKKRYGDQRDTDVPHPATSSRKRRFEGTSTRQQQDSTLRIPDPFPSEARLNKECWGCWSDGHILLRCPNLPSVSNSERNRHREAIEQRRASLRRSPVALERGTADQASFPARGSHPSRGQTRGRNPRHKNNNRRYSNYSTSSLNERYAPVMSLMSEATKLALGQHDTKNDQFIIRLKTNVTTLRCLIDTGSQVNLMPLRLAKKLWPLAIEQIEPPMRIRGVNGGEQEVHERLGLTIQYEQQNFANSVSLMKRWPRDDIDMIIGSAPKPILTHLILSALYHVQATDMNPGHAHPLISDVLLNISAMSDAAEHAELVHPISLMTDSHSAQAQQDTDLWMQQFRAKYKDTAEFEDDESIELDPEDGIQELITRAVANGLPLAKVAQLHGLLRRHINVFRHHLKPSDEAAKVTPCLTIFKPGAEPVFCKYRKQSQAESEWIKSFTQELLECNLVVRNYNSPWASPAFAVRKPGGDGYRMVVDLRAVNSRSIPTYWPMPHLESIVSRMTNSKIFISLDMFKGFWLMPLDSSCQEPFSFCTEHGVYTPLRTLQGAANSALQFQARMSEVFCSIDEQIEIWIDDLLGHVNTVDEWFLLLSKILALVQKHNLKLSFSKTDLFTTQTKFCGRIFSAAGVAHDPKRVQQLMQIPYPRTSKELQQFLLCSQWMSSHIPNFSQISSPLMDIFNESMQGEAKRTKRMASKKLLSDFGWNAQHDAAFDSLKAAIKSSTELAFPDSNKIQCIYTDASDVASAGMVTQIPRADLHKPHEEQRHEPLGFCGHRFSQQELRWATPDKEAYAIVDLFKKLNYLLIGETYVYTDHKNLLTIFNPEKATVQSSQRLTRWAMLLTHHQFTLKHIVGIQNVWADLMSRWGAGLEDDAEQCAISESTPYSVLVAVTDCTEPDFEYRVQPLQNHVRWPSEQDILDSQKVNGLTGDTDPRSNLIIKNGKILIASQDLRLRIQLVVIAHARRGGHYGQTLTLQQLREVYNWPELESDVRRIVAQCLHCLPTRGGIKVPRPLGTAVHGRYPSQVLHFDFLYMHPGPKPWVLVIRDDFTGMVQLTCTEVPESEIVAKSLLKWRSQHGRSDMFVSDQASYFKGRVLASLSTLMGVEQHLTTAYIHYPNGTIEVINKLILQAVRTILSELRMKKSDWPDVIPIIEYYLNHKPQTRLNQRAPVQVMNGVTPDNPLKTILPDLQFDKLQKIKAENMDLWLSDLQDQLETMHREVDELTETQRARYREYASRKRVRVNFDLGDYVLISKEPVKTAHKLYLKWRGPYQIVQADSHYVFKVKDIVNDDEIVVHGERMRLYAHEDLKITTEIKLQKTYDDESFIIEKCLNQRVTARGVEIFIKWRGFDEIENTWEPIAIIENDAPQLLQEFLATSAKSKKSRKNLEEVDEDLTVKAKRKRKK